MANAWAMLPVVMPAITSSSTAAGYDPANMINDHAGVVFKSATGQTSVSLVVDCGSPQRIDAAAFFGCTGASPLWTLTVISADDPSTLVNRTFHATNVPFLAGADFPTHGRGVGYWTMDTVPPPRRYWRFVIGNLGNAPVTIARLAIGRRVQLARNFAFGAAWGVRDLGSLDFSPAGVRVRRRAAKLRVLGLTFSAVEKDEVESKVQPLTEMAGGQEPIVICTDPTPDPNRQRRCWFGHLTGDIGQVWKSARSWEWKANLVDLVPVVAGLSTPGVPIFDFSGGAMVGNATFARASTGTYTDVTGTLITAANDVARFDYDPVSHAYLGLLIEPAGTNLVTNSEDFSAASWNKGGAPVPVITVNNRAAPDGTTTADQVDFSAGDSRLTNFGSPVAGVTNTGSVYAYATGAVNLGLVFYDNVAGSRSVTVPVPANRWVQLTASALITAGATDRRFWLTNNVLGAPAVTVWLWGAQVEQAASASSYVKTTTATATRAADVLTLNWGAMGVPDGLWTIRYTFDDGSTQDVVTTVASGVAIVPTNLNRRWLRSAEKI